MNSHGRVELMGAMKVTLGLEKRSTSDRHEDQGTFIKVGRVLYIFVEPLSQPSKEPIGAKAEVTMGPVGRQRFSKKRAVALTGVELNHAHPCHCPSMVCIKFACDQLGSSSLLGLGNNSKRGMGGRKSTKSGTIFPNSLERVRKYGDALKTTGPAIWRSVVGLLPVHARNLLREFPISSFPYFDTVIT